MRSRTFALLAILMVVVSVVALSGCASEKTPPPTVDNTNAETTKSVETTLGADKAITVALLIEGLQRQGLKAGQAPAEGEGLFLPAKYQPLTVNGAFVQTYRFGKASEAKAAAATVEEDGYVLGATPTQRVNVNWTGWPAFFRSGDMIVIFVTEKGSRNAARDKRVYTALQGVLGAPFMGGNTPPASGHTSGSTGATGSAPATGTGD